MDDTQNNGFLHVYLFQNQNLDGVGKENIDRIKLFMKSKIILQLKCMITLPSVISDTKY